MSLAAVEGAEEAFTEKREAAAAALRTIGEGKSLIGARRTAPIKELGQIGVEFGRLKEGRTFPMLLRLDAAIIAAH